MLAHLCYHAAWLKTILLVIMRTIELHIDGCTFNTVHIASLRVCTGLGVLYYVKWKGLGYDECSWEAPADLLPKFSAEIARYHNQHPIANELAQRKTSHSQVQPLSTLT